MCVVGVCVVGVGEDEEGEERKESRGWRVGVGESGLESRSWRVVLYFVLILLLFCRYFVVFCTQMF